MEKQDTLISINKGFDYLTSCADGGWYCVEDFKALEQGTQDITERDTLSLILENAPCVYNKFNKLLYRLLAEGSINDKNIRMLNEIWEALAEEDWQEVSTLLNFDIKDYLGCDYIIDNPYNLRKEANRDLMANGVDANALQWVNKLDYHYALNVIDYNNEVEGYSDLAEIVDDLVDFADIENAIKNALEV